MALASIPPMGMNALSPTTRHLTASKARLMRTSLAEA